MPIFRCMAWGNPSGVHDLLIERVIFEDDRPAAIVEFRDRYVIPINNARILPDVPYPLSDIDISCETVPIVPHQQWEP